jgi:prepilin-type N-terminal cleavage/methylation domain-containing protein
MSTAGLQDARGARSAQSGSTLIEVLIVVAIIGILANLGVPLTLYLAKRAQAQSIVNDFLVVQQAAIQYHSDRSHFPGECSTGEEPAELRPYMKGNVNWSNSGLEVQFDWENWMNADGEPRYPAFGVLAGFTVETGNSDLLQMIRLVYPGPYVVTFRNTRITLAIQTR